MANSRIMDHNAFVIEYVFRLPSSRLPETTSAGMENKCLYAENERKLDLPQGEPVCNRLRRVKCLLHRAS